MVFFTACNEPNDLGMELLPARDLIEVKNLVEKNSISSFTYREDSIPTDEASKSLLGSFYDPVFGITTINLATQFRLQGFPDFGTNPVVDSVRLILFFDRIYGDTITPQKFEVYELNSPLDVDANYYQDIDLESMASDQLLGEIQYAPVFEVDTTSKDTLPMIIPLNNMLGEKLLNADSLNLINNDEFLEFFKGLYIKSGKQLTEGGSIISLVGSSLRLYYNNNENLEKEKPDSLFKSYSVTQFSARVNSIEHDYSGTPFEANLNVDSGDDSLIYVQATGGLKSKIYIDGLTSWKDSTNVGINKAELVFQVDTVASELDKYSPPTQLLFTVLDEEGTEFLPSDYSFSSTYYGGGLRSDYTYRFNITQHMQQIIDGVAENHGFFLTTARKNSEAKRVVLKGSNSQTGIKLVITYSKFLQ